MATALAGLLIMTVLFTAMIALTRTSLLSNTLMGDSISISTRLEDERAKTAPTILTSVGDRNGNILTLTVRNDGVLPVPASDFGKMDVVVFYDSAAQAPVRLAYTAADPPPAGQWTQTAISGILDPDIWDPVETLSILATLVGADCAPGTVTVGTPNGVIDTNPFICTALDLTFHSETTSINGTTYYQLKDKSPADGIATTVSVVFAEGVTGRLSPTSNAGKFVYPLTGISVISAANWDLTYRIKRDKVDMGWIWLVDAQDISINPGGWSDIDLSAYVPVEATGVIVEVVNASSGQDRNGLVKAKEDTRDYMSNASFEEITTEAHRWQTVKLDSNRVIEGFVSNPSVDFKLIGYTVGPDPDYIIDSGVTPDITPIAADKWTTVDVSNWVDADANGVILLVDSEDAGKKKYLIREQGGDEVTKDKINPYSNTIFFVGLNASKHFEIKVADATIRFYLVAQTKESVGYYVADIKIDDPPEGDWEEMDADDFGIPTVANGVILHYDGEKDKSEALGFRHGDSNDDWNKDVLGDTHGQAIAGLNSDNVWEQYMEDDKFDVWIAGYTRLIRLDAKANVDIIIRRADGTIRTTLLTGAAETANLTSDSWQTSKITFAFPGYTVVDDTDYLEIDLYAEATTNLSGESVTVDFRIDDPSLPIAGQMKAAEFVP